jgi:hypothetical protein
VELRLLRRPWMESTPWSAWCNTFPSQLSFARRWLIRAITVKMQVMESITTQSQAEKAGSATGPPPERVRIVSTPGICGGKPRIDGHRITVKHVVLDHQRGG